MSPTCYPFAVAPGYYVATDPVCFMGALPGDPLYVWFLASYTRPSFISLLYILYHSYVSNWVNVWLRFG